MSRIIESCRQCGFLRRDYMPYYCTYPLENSETKISIEPSSIPSSCPLPKLDDKLREAWDASHKATMDALGSYDYHHNRKSFEQWVAEYKNAKSTE